MPLALSYPGVYIEEVPSGVRPITGAATSIAAFVGRTRLGPTNEPTVIDGWADYERRFGGLWTASPVSVAVRDFFLNGGGQAVIVRVFAPDMTQATNAAAMAADAVADAAEASVAGAADAPAVATAAATAAAAVAEEPAKSAALAVAARAKAFADASENSALKAETAAAARGAVDTEVAKAVASAAATAHENAKHTARLGTGDAQNDLKLRAASPGAWANGLRARIDKRAGEALFTLTVRDGDTGVTEQFAELSNDPNHKRRIDRVIESASSLVRLDGLPLGASPDPTGQPPTGTKWWEDDTSSFRVASASQATDGAAPSDEIVLGSQAAKAGLYALAKAEEFNLLCIPPHDFTEAGSIGAALIEAASQYCADRRAIFLIDPPASWKSKDVARSEVDSKIGAPSRNAAVYFPRILRPSPFPADAGAIRAFAPCGAVAGVIARTDAQRGVWKAPAGLEATLVNAPELEVRLTDAENGELNPKGINCLRTFPAAGKAVWGARTRVGAEGLADEWKYLSVRRTALFIEESLYRGTQWVVFEPNDEPLWASIRLSVGAFMQQQFRKGAFQGRSSREAYFVKCDGETTTQADINLGIVNVLVGFAPLKPAEFVVVRIQQTVGNIST